MRMLTACLSVALAIGLGAALSRAEDQKDKPSYVQAVLADKPVGYWRLGETNTNDPAKDQTGNKLDGKYTDGVVLGKPGPLGKQTTAAEFTGGGEDSIDLGNPSKLDIKSGKITIEAWVKAEDTEGLRDIVGRGHVNDPPGEIFLRVESGSFSGGSWDGPAHMVTTPIKNRDTGQWVHLALVHDGAAWRLYYNGAEAAKTDDATGPVPVVGGAWTVGAGSYPDDSRYFQGGIAEVAIYDSALSADRIKAHYDAAKAAAAKP